jgi:hypothetical protein
MAGATTQAERQAQVLAAGYNGPLTDEAINQAYANAATPADLASSSGNTTTRTGGPYANSGSTGTTTGGGSGSGAGAAQLGQGIDQILGALQSGNQQEFNEAVREYNQNFGFSQEQFQESVRQYNQNLAVTAAGLTGTYNGQPTQQALAQSAALTGYYNGQVTPAQQQNAANIAATQAGLTGYYQQPTAYSWNTLSQHLQQAAGANYNDNSAKQTWAALTGQDINNFNGAVAVSLTPDQINQLAAAGGAQPGTLPGSGQGQQTLAGQQQAYTQQLGVINAAAALQANPFRQQQAIGQLGGLLGGQGVAGFQAPTTVAGVGTAGGNTQGGMGYLQQMIDDINSGGATNQSSMQGILDAIPTPNKLNSVEFQNAAPSTQSLVLQGMQEKYGLDPNDALKQIQSTLPQFTAPTTIGGTVKR